ncbi:MAG TPA: CHAD domain-containing protein [Acetobacteraceae bacterium]|nr:CHAD domain-containing protein [Acetobacteraceae bacterium]
MDIELSLHPDDAQRLLRLPLLASATRGRAQVRRIVWHDSADAALTASGLALALERGTWRLEKLVPEAADFWPAGMPAPVLAQAAVLEELRYDLPLPLAPVVAFTGRQRNLVLETEQGTVTVGVLSGTLRAVTEERHVVRVHVTGDERGVLLVALGLAAELRVAVALATLAGEALSSARGTNLPVRRLGAPVLPEALQAADAFAFALAHLTDVVLHFAPAAAEDRSGPEPVHQMRVALRRLRSTVTVFRPLLDAPELQAATAGLKALGQRLGPTRDWDVFLTETLPPVSMAFPRDGRLARLAAAAGRRRRECHAALRAFLEGAEFRRLGIELAWLAGARCWCPPLPADGDGALSLPGFAAEVLARRLRKLHGGDDMAERDAAELHQLRLRVKRVRYAAELFEPLYPGKPMRRMMQRLAGVQDGLGRLNDLSTAETLLAQLGGPGGRFGYAVGLALGFTAAHSTEILPRVMRRWAKLQRVGRPWE